jgi:bifunctional DNase/RNase
MTGRKRDGGKVGKKGHYDMAVQGFALDSLSQKPMVLLKDGGEDRMLPLWFSTVEAVAIAAELIHRDAMAESGCRDIMTTLLGRLRVSIERIAIEGMKGRILEACVYFSMNGEEIRVKARPFEAVVMALKHSLPIRVAGEVVEKASTLDLADDEGIGESAAERFIELLENLDPKEMGKYPM